MIEKVEMRLLIHGASQVVRVAGSGERVKKGETMADLAILQKEEHDKEGFSIAVDDNGIISAIGKDLQVAKAFSSSTFSTTLDATNCAVLPGLVDAHTHSVWAGNRVHEFAMKLAGATYLEIHDQGGGIHFTVEKTKEATVGELQEEFCRRVKRMEKTGTTFLECKSGYGLDLATELKMLRVIESARDKVNADISATYCGAHAVPKNMSPTDATKLIIEEHIPAILKAHNAKEINVDSIDVFCEKGVFGLDESRAILEAGKEAGFMLNFHAEELSYLGGAELGANLGATAISHLEQVSAAGIAKMSAAATTAILLPTTALVLRLQPPPAREMIDANVPVALGSDFNPNAHCTSMPLVMHLACVMMKMSLAEALTASTLNAAYALRKSEERGSLEVGKIGDMMVVERPRWEHLVYELGGENDVISHVIHKGKITHFKK